MNIINKMTLSHAMIMAACVSSQVWAGKCESPSDYVRKVFSSEEGRIQYELDPAIRYKEITVEFFGKSKQVRRDNTVLTLKNPAGTFSVPDRVYVPPAQLWFNFVVKDNSGCKMWSLVNEVPVQGKDNLIGIGNPTGDGDAFFIKQRR